MRYNQSQQANVTGCNTSLASSAGNALPPTRTFIDCILGGLFSDNPDPEKLDSYQKAYKFFRTVWNNHLINEQEQVYAVFVDKYLNLIDWKCLFTGSADDVHLDVAIIARKALECKAQGVFLAHNHPSADESPSDLDIKATGILKNALKLFGIQLVDHQILTLTSYYSFAEGGKL